MLGLRSPARIGAALASIWLLVLPGVAAAGEDDERLRRAVAHVLSTQLPNGLFRYDFDFLEAEPSGEDNIVRQAGTVFALGEYLRDTGDSAVVAPLRAAFDALAKRSLPLGRGRVQSALESAGVFSIVSERLARQLERAGVLFDPTGDGRVVSGDDSYPGAHTGATALALLGELEYFRATHDDRYRALRESWLRGLLALHVPGGGVREHPATLAQGPYIDGEAWLALAHYHETFPDEPGAAQALRELEDHVIERYSATPDRAFFQWGAMAAAARLSTGDATRLAEFAAVQAEFILDAAPPDESRTYSTCGLLEGLASAVAVVGSRPGRDALLVRLRERVASELDHNRALQIEARQVRLPLGAGGMLTAPTLAQNHGAFLAGPHRPYTRTDVTQHCISALLKARRYGLDGAGP